MQALTVDGKAAAGIVKQTTISAPDLGAANPPGQPHVFSGGIDLRVYLCARRATTG